jgi:hypothetical protein
MWEPQSPGTLRAYTDLYWDCFTFFRTGITEIILTKNRISEK